MGQMTLVTKPTPSPALPALPGLSQDELSEWLAAQKEPTFRAKQVLDWVWKKKSHQLR